MNKVFSFALCIITLTISSCSANRELSTNAHRITGNWQLNTIISEAIKSETVITLFNEADFRCFIGSSWNFTKDIASYSISSSSDGRCNKIKRNHTWRLFINNQKSMLIQLKKLGDNMQEADPGSIGYLFEIITLNSKAMQLRSEIMINGHTGVFLFNFIKL